MWTESNTPSKIEGAGGADVPKALIYRKLRPMKQKRSARLLSASGARFAATEVERRPQHGVGLFTKLIAFAK